MRLHRVKCNVCDRVIGYAPDILRYWVVCYSCKKTEDHFRILLKQEKELK